MATASWDGSAKIWDICHGKEICSVPNISTTPRHMLFCPSHRHLVFQMADESPALFIDVASGELSESVLEASGPGCCSPTPAPDG